MSLVSKIARFAASPQGRRSIDQARTKLDTPENRQRLTEMLGKVRGGGAARDTGPAAGKSSKGDA